MQVNSTRNMIRDVPALQLGIQAYTVPTSVVPQEQQDRLEYRLLRVGSTFGRDGFEVQDGRVDLKFDSEASVVVHDLYPRREEQVEQNALEIGLDTALTWGLFTATPSMRYKTTITRINTVLSSGGLLDSYAWWRFSPRKGEHCIEGSMETLLTLQSRQGKEIKGKATLQGRFSRKNLGQENVGFDFKL